MADRKRCWHLLSGKRKRGAELLSGRRYRLSGKQLCRAGGRCGEIQVSPAEPLADCLSIRIDAQNRSQLQPPPSVSVRVDRLCPGFYPDVDGHARSARFTFETLLASLCSVP